MKQKLGKTDNAFHHCTQDKRRKLPDGAAHPRTTEKRSPGRPFPHLGELQTALRNAQNYPLVDPFRDPIASRFPGDAKVAIEQ